MDHALCSQLNVRMQLGRSPLRALRNTGISVLYQDRRSAIVWAQNIPPFVESDAT